MTDDLIRDLSRLQNHAARLAELIETAQNAAPETITATDRTGTISVTLGPDGLPTTFRVDQHWRRRVEPSKFGQVVLEAHEVAMSRRLATWSRTLNDRGWQASVDELRASSSTSQQIPPAFRRPERAANPRPIDAVAEDMIRALDQASDVGTAQQHSTVGTGADRWGKLTLTVSPTGLASCVVKVRWAAKQTGTALTNALVEALAAARADLAQADGNVTHGPDLSSLFGEAIALLNDPKRMMDH